MQPAQALAHCSESIAMAVGDLKLPRIFMGRIFGRLIKSLALKDDQPLRRNTPTVDALIVRNVPDLPTEQERLIGLINRFAAAGPAGCTTHPHSFFGRLTPQEWAILMYKHLDHHLRQFGA